MAISELSPTLRFITALVSGEPAPPEGVDWERALALLQAHHLGGLAVAEDRACADAGRPFLPDRVRDVLLERYLRTATLGRLQLECLHRCRSALADAGVPSLAFKGAALLEDGTYGDPGARALEDVDVLVPKAQAESAVRALEGAGFRPWTPWESRHMDWVGAFTLQDSRGPAGMDLVVDLHWSTLYAGLRGGESGDGDPLWAGADVEAGRPGPEAHFVLLADHLLKHLRVTPHVRGMADLARTARRLTDAGRLRAQERLRGSRGAGGVMLSVLRRLYGVPVDEGVAEAAGGGGSPPRAARRLLAPRALLEEGRTASRPAGLVLRWQLAGPAGVWRDLRDVLAPPDRWLGARYPDVAGRAARRVRHLAAVAAWLAGSGPSPLSPNQEWEEG